MNSRAILITLLTTTNALGCYSTWDIHPDSLRNLDGFRQGEERVLIAKNGERVTFTGDTVLSIRMRDGSLVNDLQMHSAYMTANKLVATEQGYGRVTRMRIDLPNVESVRAAGPDVDKTSMATTGIILGSVGVVGLGVAIMAMAVAGAGGGRPLHVAGRDNPVRANVLLHAAPGPSFRDKHVDATTQARLLQHWANEAGAECASIPAFLALARDLKRVGAPSALVEQVVRAANEEAIHTHLCTTLANAHAPGQLLVQTPHTPPNVDIDRNALLERLALEAFWDGCIAEGIAASVARRSISQTKIPDACDALRTISRDEQKHAELSRHILGFCLSMGGTAIRDALVESLEQERAEKEANIDTADRSDEPPFDEDVARAYGLAGRDIYRNARAEIWEKSSAMLATMLNT